MLICAIIYHSLLTYYNSKIEIMKLSIIVPVYNEESTIRGIINRIQAVRYPIDHEIIIVDDASIDRTTDKEFFLKLKNRSENHNIKVFKNRVNRGKGFSIRKGIRRAKGEILIVQDADMEYDPQDIPKLIEPIIRGDAGVVYGSRFLQNKRPNNMAFPNWIANKFLTILTNILFDLRITDLCTCYKAFKTNLIKSLPLRANRFTFCPEVTALLAKRKIAIKELPISYCARDIKSGKKVRAKDFFYFILMLIWQRVNRLR